EQQCPHKGRERASRLVFAQYVGERAAGNAVAAHGVAIHRDHSGAEQRKLGGGWAQRINEGRQHRGEEHDRLWVGELHGEAIAKSAGEIGALAHVEWRDLIAPRRPQRLGAEPSDIQPPDYGYETESERKG